MGRRCCTGSACGLSLGRDIFSRVLVRGGSRCRRVFAAVLIGAAIGYRAGPRCRDITKAGGTASSCVSAIMLFAFLAFCWRLPWWRSLGSGMANVIIAVAVYFDSRVRAAHCAATCAGAGKQQTFIESARSMGPAMPPSSSAIFCRERCRPLWSIHHAHRRVDYLGTNLSFLGLKARSLRRQVGRDAGTRRGRIW